MSFLPSPRPLQDLDDESGEMAVTKSRYVVAQLPLRVPVVRPVLDKPNPKLGVGELRRHSSLPFTKSACMPYAAGLCLQL